MERSEINQRMEERVRPYIDLVDQLRNIGVNQDIPLPQIAVVGDQSSGKSSLLEALSGIPFPRGTGLTTRCPTEIIMKKGGDDWHAMASIPGESRVVNSQEALAGTIEELTNRLTAGNTSGFSQTPIRIELQAPTVPDLTIIDLPGIIRTTTSGQSMDVIMQVNSMIEDYLRNERTIILCVIPANQDIATIDILERANMHDPEGKRTLGVLTKPDLVGEGAEEEVMKILRNEIKPLRLGYSIVKNRSQQEINDNVTIEEMKERERAYFSSHRVYRQVEELQIGVHALSDRCTDILVNLIQESIPHMQSELRSLQRDCQQNLHRLGVSQPHKQKEKQRLLMSFISLFCSTIREAAGGKYSQQLLSSNPQLRLKTLSESLFAQLRTSLLNTQPDFASPTFDIELQQLMRDLRGRELPGFFNTQLFFGFTQIHIENWRPLVNNTLDDMNALIQTVCENLIALIAPQYQHLRSHVMTVVKETIDLTSEEIESRMEEIFNRENNSYASQDTLVNSINRVRFSRFDAMLHNTFSNTSSDTEAAALQKKVMDEMGSWYLQMHGLGCYYELQDAKNILEVYWDICYRHLLDEIFSIMDSTLLTNLTQALETNIIESISKQSSSSSSLAPGSSPLSSLSSLASYNPLESKTEEPEAADSLGASNALSNMSYGEMVSYLLEESEDIVNQRNMYLQKLERSELALKSLKSLR